MHIDQRLPLINTKIHVRYLCTFHTYGPFIKGVNLLVPSVLTPLLQDLSCLILILYQFTPPLIYEVLMIIAKFCFYFKHFASTDHCAIYIARVIVCIVFLFKTKIKN